MDRLPLSNQQIDQAQSEERALAQTRLQPPPGERKRLRCPLEKDGMR